MGWEQTPAVQTIILLLMAIFALGVAGVIATNLLILQRTKYFSTFSEEKRLSWGERKGRQFSRLTPFFVDSRFKRLRMAMFCSIGLSMSSFASLVLIDALWR
ncbi:hypothetical protein DFR48_110174 [Ciceribacter lividus]|uniref:Uncharacterized protein n=1 Tax=Ciceribacter lividus TaxID=1197950 RepID=A0A6I7HJJ5_9HYPH|nr:hypothetical protein DFR48_110174 [Ciceribacter lividus]